MDVIPAVDVLKGRVVRLINGDYSQVTTYEGDPVSHVEEWGRQGASIVHVVDLDGARAGQPDTSLIRSIVETGIPVQVGGGFRNAIAARGALHAGVRRVVMGTAAVWNPQVLAEVGRPSRVVAAVDVRGGRATGGGWTDEGRDTGDVLDGIASAGIDRILVTGIGSDGTMHGPEIDLMSRMTSDGRFRVIASGGVGELRHLAHLARLGCESAVVGRALYEGRFTLDAALTAVLDIDSGGG